jgi:hypothetical protein
MVKLKTSAMFAGLAIAVGVGSPVLFNGIAHGEWDYPGLQQQVQHVSEVTDNHEGRITNLETKTDTPAGQPTPTPVVVTKVVTQAAPASTAKQATAEVLAATAVPVAPATPKPTPNPKAVKIWYIMHVTDCPGANRTYYITEYNDGTRVERPERAAENTDATLSNTGNSQTCKRIDL